MDLQEEIIIKYFPLYFKGFFKEFSSEMFSVGQLKFACTHLSRDPVQLELFTNLLMKPISEQEGRYAFFCFQRRIQHNLILVFNSIQSIYAKKILQFLWNHHYKLDSWGIFLLNGVSDLNKEGNSKTIFTLKHVKAINREGFLSVTENVQPVIPLDKVVNTNSSEVIQIDSDDDNDFLSICEGNLSDGKSSMQILPLTTEGKLSEDSFNLLINFSDYKNQPKQLEDLCDQLQVDKINEENLADFINIVSRLPNANRILHFSFTKRIIHSKQMISRLMYNILLDLFNSNINFLLDEAFCTIILNKDFSNCHEDIFRKLILDGLLNVSKIEQILKNVLKVKVNWNSVHVSLFDCFIREKPKISQDDFNRLLISFESSSLKDSLKLMKLSIFLIEAYPCDVNQSYSVLENIISLNTSFLKKNASNSLKKLKLKSNNCNQSKTFLA